MKQEVDQYLGTNLNFFYWKGRVALYALLKAMDIKEGDEVIIPAFTCVVVPNAIKYLGATPIYVDIDKYALNPTAEEISLKITERTKVIICQNTLGLSYQVEEIVSLAKEKGIYTIEDCTHGYGGTYNGKPNGSYCDAAFYSTQWNKPFSTGIGGFASINNEKLLPSLEEVNKQLVQPSFKEELILKVLLFVRQHLLTPKTYWIMVKLYRWLSRMNLVVGSSQGEEIEGVKIPSNYFKGISSTQMEAGKKNIKRLNEVLHLRKKNALIYTEYLKSKGKYYVKETFNSNHSFLKYPFLVRDRAAFLLIAEENEIELGEWFNSPIHPIQDDFEVWDLDVTKCPVGQDISSKMLNLPTDIKNPNKVLQFLDKYIDYIE